jgi:hypothetical protein
MIGILVAICFGLGCAFLGWQAHGLYVEWQEYRREREEL